MAAVSSRQDHDKSSFKGRIGLVNIGNSCYMNSAIQSLSNCPPFRQYMIDCLPAQSTSNLSAALSLVFRKMWTSERNPGSLSPRPISSSMKQKAFRGWQQQDAQEFLRCLFSQIHEELSVPLPSYYDKYRLPITTSNNNIDGDNNGEGSLEGSSSSDESMAELSQSNMEESPPTLAIGPNNGAGQEMSRSYSSSDESMTELIRPAQPNTSDNTTTCSNSSSNNKINNKLDSSPSSKLSSSSRTPPTKESTSTRGHYSHLSSDIDTTQDNDVSPLNISNNSTFTNTSAETSVRVIDPNLFNETVLLCTDVNTGHIAVQSSEGEQSGIINDICSQLKLIENDTTSDAPKTVSIVTEIFQGEFESKVTCLNCSKVSVTIEPFQDLSLPIPSRKEMAKLRKEDVTTQQLESSSPSPPPPNSLGSRFCRAWNNVIGIARDLVTGPPTSLTDCLESFFDYSELSGDNRYFCQHCNSLQNSRKETSILNLPEILCVHLKRFRYDGFFTSKIGRYVEFPMTDLNMKPYLKSNNDDQDHQYSLLSVITHLGGAGGGHYICYAKSDDQWLEYNDTRVSTISSDDVQGIEGYLLFYQKQSIQPITPIKMADIVPLPNTHIPSDDVCYISRHWILKRNSCVNPGPVVPYEFACEHGGTVPGKESVARASALPIQRLVWDNLIERYGGGPLISKLETCQECKRYLSELNDCRKEETRKVNEIQTANKGFPEVILLSQSWLKKWQNFIHCESLDIISPGPINNLSLLKRTGDDSIKLDTKRQCRYISLPVWKYLHNRYGGGPLITKSKETLILL